MSKVPSVMAWVWIPSAHMKVRHSDTHVRSQRMGADRDIPGGGWLSSLTNSESVGISKRSCLKEKGGGRSGAPGL